MDRLRSRLLSMRRSVFRREKVFVFERILADTCFEKESKVKIIARLAKWNDLPKISKRSEESGAVAEKRFKMGHICLVADLQGSIVHSEWIAFNQAYMGELERSLRMNSDSAYVYDRYTVPKYRGLGIASQVMKKANSYLHERGFRKVYICVQHNNFPSLKAVQKEGFRRMGTITFTRIFSLRLYRLKGETNEEYKNLKTMLSI